MKFIKTHWFSILLIGILVFVLLRTQKQNEELVKQVKGLETLNENLVEQSINTTDSEIKAILQKSKYSINDFPKLIIYEIKLI